jgi:hypothetical protein
LCHFVTGGEQLQEALTAEQAKVQAMTKLLDEAYSLIALNELSTVRRVFLTWLHAEAVRVLSRNQAN